MRAQFPYANSAHMRQPRPDSGLDFQVKVSQPFQGVPFSLGSDQPGGNAPGDTTPCKSLRSSYTGLYAEPRVE